MKESLGKVRTEGKDGYYWESGRERKKRKTRNEVLEHLKRGAGKGLKVGRGLRSSLRETHREWKGKKEGKGWVPVMRGGEMEGEMGRGGGRERQSKERTERQGMRFGTMQLEIGMEAF